MTYQSINKTVFDQSPLVDPLTYLSWISSLKWISVNDIASLQNIDIFKTFGMSCQISLMKNCFSQCDIDWSQ